MSIEKITIPISEMICASCTMAIENALKKIDGIASVNVNIVTEEATIEYDSKKTNVDQIKKAINETGYQVKN